MNNDKKRESGPIEALANDGSVNSPQKRRKNVAALLGADTPPPVTNDTVSAQARKKKNLDQFMGGTPPSVSMKGTKRDSTQDLTNNAELPRARRKKDLDKLMGATSPAVSINSTVDSTQAQTHKTVWTPARRKQDFTKPIETTKNEISNVTFGVAVDGAESVKKKGHVVGTALLYGFQEVEKTQYHQNLESRLRGTGLSAQMLTITTRDGTPIEGLHIIANPKSNKTIVVFQGQRGNYQSEEQLNRIIELAQRSGQNVVAYNYQRTLNSIDVFENDAAVVCDYVFKQIQTTADNLTLYGESLGGAVAARTAARLKTEEREVNVILVRTPKSLIQALQSLLERVPIIAKPAIKIAQSLLNGFGDFDPESDLRSLNASKVKTMALKQDNYFGENSVRSTNHVICIPKENVMDPHNADLTKLRVLDPTGQNVKTREDGNRNVPVTALDEFLEAVKTTSISKPANEQNRSERAGWTKGLTSKDRFEQLGGIAHISDTPSLPDDTGQTDHESLVKK